MSNKPPKREKSSPGTQPNHYIDNAKFYDACLDHWNRAQVAIAAGQSTPKLNDYIGSCLMKIATKLSYSKNFIRYAYREDMVLDGVENCILYFHNFNPTKYKNPFSYFTTVIYWAFVRRIHREKAQMYVKYKAMCNMIDTGLSSTNEFDDTFDVVNIDDKITDNEYMKNFISTYELKMQERKDKRTASNTLKRDDVPSTKPKQVKVDEFFND